MKASRYNLFVHNSEVVYAVNLLSRAAIELSVQAFERYSAILAGTARVDQEEFEGFEEVLRSNFFILEDDFDELAYIVDRSHHERFGSKQLGLVITPTMGCNFNCHYCFEAKDNSYLSDDAREQLVEYVEQQIRDYDELAVQWFGGEPLQSMPIIEELSHEFLRITASADASYAATVITNGYFLTKNVSTTLVKLGTRVAQITLDGDKTLHDKTRRQRGGNGSFDVILNNIRNTPQDLAIQVRVHVSPFNFESVHSLIDRLSDEGMADEIDFIYFAPLFNYRVGMQTRAYAPDGKRFTTSQGFAEMQVDLLRHAAERGFKLKDFLDVAYGICTAVRASTIVVDSSGNLTKCYKDVGVTSETIGSVWTGLTDTTKVSEWTNVELPRDDECRECTFLPVCLGGCTKQWREGADKSVICTPLRYNYEERISLYFSE